MSNRTETSIWISDEERFEIIAMNFVAMVGQVRQRTLEDYMYTPEEALKVANTAVLAAALDEIKNKIDNLNF